LGLRFERRGEEMSDSEMRLEKMEEGGLFRILYTTSMPLVQLSDYRRIWTIHHHSGPKPALQS
jgi:hypothetical protein